MTTDGMPGTAQSAVRVELETLTTFRDRVNGLLASLESGPAAPGRIAAQQLAAGHLGTDFQEVGHLMARYQLVHSQLQGLSKALTDQVNAMGIALQVSQVGYRNVETETIDRLWAIQNQVMAAQPASGHGELTVNQQIAAARSSRPGPIPTPMGHRSS